MITFTRSWRGYAAGTSVSTLADTIEALAVAEGAATYGGVSGPPNSYLDADNRTQALVDGGGNSYALAQDATATVMPDEIVRLTASGCANASPCYISRIRCVSGTSIALTVYDNAAASSGTQLYSGTLSAGQDAALSSDKVHSINGVRLAWTGAATFDISTGQEAT